MAYRVEFLPEAAREFEKLDGSLRRLAAKQLDKLGARPPNVLLRAGHYSDGLLTERPDLGEPLGKRMGIDLTGYRKTYFGKKAYRIVYEVQRERVVVWILGIGKRERAEIYEEVFGA